MPLQFLGNRRGRDPDVLISEIYKAIEDGVPDLILSCPVGIALLCRLLR
jgi:hypothetical protein